MRLLTSRQLNELAFLPREDSHEQDGESHNEQRDVDEEEQAASVAAAAAVGEQLVVADFLSASPDELEDPLSEVVFEGQEVAEAAFVEDDFEEVDTGESDEDGSFERIGVENEVGQSVAQSNIDEAGGNSSSSNSTSSQEDTENEAVDAALRRAERLSSNLERRAEVS